MKKRVGFYILFFVVLIGVFYYVVQKNVSFPKNSLPVINANLPAFAFISQHGDTITENNIKGKVYVANYFFTTCRGICPKMNANMRRVYDAYKNDTNVVLLSHTCMPETDSVPLLKQYEKRMLASKVEKQPNGLYTLMPDSSITYNNKNWYFLTGNKDDLYKMARVAYIIDDPKHSMSSSNEPIDEQFIHTQFLALVDKFNRVRGIYDGLKNDEVDKLINDVRLLEQETQPSKSF